MSIVDLLLFVSLYACHTVPDAGYLPRIDPTHIDTVITGRAVDTKLSAAVLRNNELFFIKGLSSWQDTCYGRIVSITGKIENKSLLLTSHADSSSQISDISNIHIVDREPDVKENEFFQTVQNSQVRKGFQYTSIINIRGVNPIRSETILTYSLSDSAFCMFDAEVIACRE